MSKKETKYKLHFVGKNYYSQQSFISESKRFGVNRALPFAFLKSLSFGDQILLANYLPFPKPTRTIKQIKSDVLSNPNVSKTKIVDDVILNQLNKEKSGQAEVFGYFTLTGISHNLPLELSLQLHDKLDIVHVDSNQTKVTRACGSYTIGSVSVIRDSLEDLVKKIEELFTTHKPEFNDDPLWEENDFCICPDCTDEKQIKHSEIWDCLKIKCECCTKIDYILINKYKWFIIGNFTPITSFIIQPIKFTRGLIKVQLKNLNLKKQQTETANLIWIKNYNLRSYMPQLMKERFSGNNFSNLFI